MAVPPVQPRANDVPPTIAALPHTARIAVAVMFFANGVGFSNWVPRIPAVRDRLDLSVGVLGAALLFPAVGAILAMPVSTWLIAHGGSRRITVLAAVAYGAALPLPAFAPTLPALALALFLLGVGNGALDVAMNAQGVAIEGRYRRPILASFHAAFSFGGLAGAATGGLAAGTGTPPGLHLAAVGTLIVAVAVVMSRRLWPTPVGGVSAAPGPIFVRPSGRLTLVSAIAFCGLVGEGAVADWSVIYLGDDLSTGAGFAAAGYAAFSLTMACGRLVGDRLTARWGPVAVARRGGLLAAGGLGLALVVGHPVAAVAGFAAVGAGLANVIPDAFSAAGRVPGVSPATGIAAVSTAGYAGFLLGPPAIGLIAELVGLPLALGLVVLLAATVARLAGGLRAEEDGGHDVSEGAE